MTLRELRTEVIVRTLQRAALYTDDLSCAWVYGRCRQCRRSEATIACVYRGRIHPWQCIFCGKDSATPAALSERWKAAIAKKPRTEWRPIWERCLTESVNDGIGADDDVD